MRGTIALKMACLTAGCLVAGSSAWAAPISYTTPSATYSQNFNTLPTSGGLTTTSGIKAVPAQSAVPADFTASYTELQGWYFTAPNFLQSDGSANTAGAYSYGTASATDRALGGLSGGAGTFTIGAQLQNTTGATLTQFTLDFTGEQWRRAGGTDPLQFSYLITSSSATTGLTAAGTAVTQLNFAPLVTGGGATLDGNNAANRTAIGHTVTGISWANGDYLWVRWYKTGTSSNGLSVDDLSFTAVPEPGAMALAGLSAGGLMLGRRRRLVG